MWRDALLVAAKDLRIERRARVVTYQVLPLAAATLVLFGLALGPGRAALLAASPGIVWIAVLLSTLLAVQRSFAVETADGAREGLAMSGLDVGGIFLGKAGAIAAQLAVLEVVLVGAAVALFGVRVASPAHVAMLAGACVLGTIALSAAGTVYGAMATAAPVRETLLPLLFLPVAAPVLLAATKLTAPAFGLAGSGPVWLGVLAGCALAYAGIGVVAFEPLLEAT